MDTVRCVVTGALGNVGYNVAFLVASGAFLGGGKKKISLRLLEIPELKGALEGLKMEIEDCAFEALADVKIGTDPNEMFENRECVFLVGARPRGPGMERKDLLLANGAIFQEQGKALDKVADRNARILVVGNPCNTNCLIALHNAPSLSPSQFFSLTGLDELRARALIANQVKATVTDVSSVTIWGNHSPTLVADTTFTKIAGALVEEKLQKNWLRTDFLTHVRQRGSEIIKARGKSSAASAAQAAVRTMGILMAEKKARISLGVYTQGNPYGLDQNLVFSFPCHVSHRGVLIDPSMKPDEELWNWVLLSQKELQEERDAIRQLL